MIKGFLEVMGIIFTGMIIKAYVKQIITEED